MLQILSYAFDASVAEIFLPLIRGGTVCIPSEEERFNKVGSAITDLECNWAFITPSLARAIPRRYLCNLHALSLGGEEVTRDDITNRFAFVPTLITSYVSVCFLVAALQNTDNRF